MGWILFADEVNVSMIVVRWPVLAEVIQKALPASQTVALKIAQREREAVVDTRDERAFGAGLVN